jgi:hypothetical protein
MFVPIPISMAFSLKSQPCSAKCSVEAIRAIDEKYDGIDIVFLTNLSEDYSNKSGFRGSKQPEME